MTKNKYNFIEGDESLRLQNLQRTTDDSSNAVLTWEWPQSRVVKLLFIFEWTTDDDIPDMETLFTNYKHTSVATRELAPRFTKNILGKVKFIAVPAYFDEAKQITIVNQPSETDWIFKKVNLHATAEIKPIHLSQFQKATLRITADDPSQLDLITQILTYAIYEQGQKVGEYPIDEQICAGLCGLYIKKTQEIKFKMDEDYSHLFKLR